MTETHKVYLLTNTQNNKVYVGYTAQRYVSERWAKHTGEARRGTDTHLYRAIRLYGKDCFSWKVIGEFSNAEEAKKAEKLWIILLRASHSDYGYNTTEGGEGPRHTEETKRKLSKLQKDNPKPPEFYAQIQSLSKTPESISKQSSSLKQAWKDGKFSSRSRRSPASLETKLKISQSLKKAWSEGRNTGIKGRSMPEETRKKISISVAATKRKNAA